MIQTKARSTRSTARAVGQRPKRIGATRQGHWQPSFAPVLRSLKNQITQLTEFLSQHALPKETELLFLTELHTLHAIRDSLEKMKEGSSTPEQDAMSRHLGKKMQSSFS